MAKTNPTCKLRYIALRKPSTIDSIAQLPDPRIFLPFIWENIYPAVS